MTELISKLAWFKDTMDEVEQIKQRLDIVELVSSYLTVKKAGASYRALCPFHNEKTPSMMISPEKQIFKCFGCFVEGTKVVTNDGLKSIEKIKKNDTVLTHQGKFHKVLVKFQRKYCGQILQLKVRGSSDSIGLTPDHKVFMIKTQNCKQTARASRLCQQRCKQNCPTKFFKDYNIEKLSISEARVGDYLILPINKTEQNVESVTLYNQRDYLKSRKGKSGFPARIAANKIKLDTDLLKIIGYWIAEGSTYARGIRFSLGSHEQEFALEIKTLIEKIFSLHVGIHQRQSGKSGIEISVSNIHLAGAFIQWCGKGAQNKKIPDFCLKLPTNQQKVLLEAIFRGDGTLIKRGLKSRAGRKSITTISPTLAYQIRDLLLRMKITPVTTISADHKDKNDIHHCEAWIVSWMPGIKKHYTDILDINKRLAYWMVPIKSIQETNYHGGVYNLMVEEDSSYVVKNFAVGNCGEGGDVLSFVMKMENLNFPETLEMLAQRTGVKLTRRTPEKTEQEAKEKDRKTRLFQINTIAAHVFHKILLTHPSGKEALTYLKKRNLSEQIMKDFMIGYAPSSRFMNAYLRKKGFTDSEITASGSPDRFYERIIFPITDVMDNVLGFTGRVLDANIQPKYLNTPETIIFHKGRILYNLVRARGDIKLQKTTVVVEGQMDVISSYQAGVKNVVATSGTALTNEHLQTLYRYTPNITFAFDSDTAGLNTTKKAYEMALSYGFNVKMVDLGKHKDPGEMIEKDPKLWIDAVKTAQPVIDWYFNLSFRENQDFTSQQKKEIAKELLPVVHKIPDSIEQAHYVEILAKKLGVPDRIIFDALNKVVSIKAKKSEPILHSKTKTLPEEILIGVLIKHQTVQKVLEESVKNITTDDFTDPWSREVYSLVLNWYNESSKKDKLLQNLELNLKKPDFNKLEMILMEVERDYANEAPVVAKDIIVRIKQQKREKLKERFAREISLAESQGDKEKLKSLMKEFQDAIR